jgi:two-component system, LytTR family, response regulator
MLKCVIVDDEFGAIEILSKYIDHAPGLVVSATFRNSLDALTYLTNNEIDIAFLDISMPDLNGMQLSSLLTGKQLQIIFCTAHSEYAAESYDHEVADYLLKPFAFDRFLKAVNRAAAALRDNISPRKTESLSNQKLFLKSGSKIHQLDLTQLKYMKKDGHYIIFHIDSGELISRMNLEELMTLLPGADFIRTHKSFVVAISRIDTIHRHYIIIENTEIPIGASFRKAFFSKIKYSGN